MLPAEADSGNSALPRDLCSSLEPEASSDANSPPHSPRTPWAGCRHGAPFALACRSGHCDPEERPGLVKMRILGPCFGRQARLTRGGEISCELHGCALNAEFRNG